MIYEGSVEDLIVKGCYDTSRFCRSDVEYVGHIPEKQGQVKGRNIRIVFHCPTCAEDYDLYGKGLFVVPLVHVSVRMCCGCSKKAIFNESQWKIVASRKAAEFGFTFTGWLTEYKGSQTRSNFLCDKHGNWPSPRLASLNTNRIYCPSCKEEDTGIKRHMSTAVTEDSFFSTGKYHANTKFTRLGTIKYTLENKNRTVYWQLDCPICQTSAITQSDILKNGGCACNCFYLNGQIQAYINIVMDGDLDVAVKFGVSKNYKARIASINYKKTPLKLRPFKVFTFEDRKSCLDAEKYCKENLICHVVSKNDIGSGYTETTSLGNIEIIESIYRKFGGQELDIYE